ncbi:MAG: hypothetical protein JJW03_03760 [Desulfosarcina sp.]|nr:hypothetical protein [Desulfobacterales bacterium]
MKELKKQLKLISGSLAILSTQIEQITEHLDKLPLVNEVSTTAEKTSDRKNSTKEATKRSVSGKKKAAETASVKKKTMLDVVFDSIKKSRNGIDIPKLRKKTGLEAKQLSNALFKLTNKGKIKPKARGVYLKA